MGGIATGSRLTVPVLARVNGYALGGGFEIVLGCDLAVATEDATFGFSEPLVGRLALSGGIIQLPRRTTTNGRWNCSSRLGGYLPPRRSNLGS